MSQRKAEPEKVQVSSHLMFTVRGPKGSYSSSTFGYTLHGFCDDTEEARLMKLMELDAELFKLCRVQRENALLELNDHIEAAEKKWGEA